MAKIGDRVARAGLGPNQHHALGNGLNDEVADHPGLACEADVLVASLKLAQVPLIRASLVADTSPMRVLRWLRANDLPGVIGVAVSALLLIALLIQSVAVLYQTWGLVGAIVGGITFLAWSLLAPALIWIAIGHVDPALVGTWIALWCSLFLLGTVSADPLRRGTSIEPMPYGRRVRFLWQNNMAGGGKDLVNFVDGALVLAALVAGWRVNGVLGVIVAILIVATVGSLARELAQVATWFVVSGLTVYPLAAIAALFVRIPSDAVAAPPGQAQAEPPTTETAAAEDAVPDPTVVDLMAALKESVDRAKDRERRHAFVVKYQTDAGEYEKEEICPSCASGEEPLAYVVAVRENPGISDADYERWASLVAIHHPQLKIDWSAFARGRGPTA